MKITDFSNSLARSQKGEKISIAQIKETLKTVNLMLKGELYKIIRKR